MTPRFGPPWSGHMLEAEAELYAAEQWYGGPAAPPAEAFLRALHARLANIQRFPRSYQLIYRNVRRAPRTSNLPDHSG